MKMLIKSIAFSTSLLLPLLSMADIRVPICDGMIGTWQASSLTINGQSYNNATLQITAVTLLYDNGPSAPTIYQMSGTLTVPGVGKLPLVSESSRCDDYPVTQVGINYLPQYIGFLSITVPGKYFNNKLYNCNGSTNTLTRNSGPLIPNTMILDRSMGCPLYGTFTRN